MTPYTTSVDVDYASAHYHHRKFDDKYEVVARAVVDGASRFITLDIQPNRVKAVEAVRDFRAMSNRKAA